MASKTLTARARRTLQIVAVAPRGVMYWEPAVKHLPNASVRSLIRRGLVEVAEDRNTYICGVVTHVMLGLAVTDLGREVLAC